MFDTAYQTFSDLLDSTGPLERHALLATAGQASREDPRPWVAALRRLRAERSIDAVVVTYLLHLVTSRYALDQALADPEVANLCEALRIVLTSDHDDDDEVDDDVAHAEWLNRVTEANLIREDMSTRYHKVEQKILRGLGEKTYANALLDLPRALEACRAGRATLLGPSWPLAFADALRATGELRERPPEAIDEFSPAVTQPAPRDVLLAILDRSSSVDRRRLAQEVSRLAEGDPFRWLDALNALRAEGRVTADESLFLADEILLCYLFEIEAGDVEEERMREQLNALATLYGVEDLDIEDGDEEELEDLPDDLDALRIHIKERHRGYVDAALRELGEAALADAFCGTDEDAYYERRRDIGDALFGSRFDPPPSWFGPELDQ